MLLFYYFSSLSKYSSIGTLLILIPSYTVLFGSAWIYLAQTLTLWIITLSITINLENWIVKDAAKFPIYSYSVLFDSVYINPNWPTYASRSTYKYFIRDSFRIYYIE